jgi:hypothetical protein
MSLRQQLDFDPSEQLCERHDASDSRHEAGARKCRQRSFSALSEDIPNVKSFRISGEIP